MVAHFGMAHATVVIGHSELCIEADRLGEFGNCTNVIAFVSISHATVIVSFGILGLSRMASLKSAIALSKSPMLCPYTTTGCGMPKQIADRVEWPRYNQQYSGHDRPSYPYAMRYGSNMFGRLWGQA